MKSLRTWKQLWRSWYMFFFQIPWLPEQLLSLNNAWLVGKMIHASAVAKERFPAEVLSVYRRQATQPGALRAMLNYYRALFRDLPWRKYGDNLPPVEIPTLMIWGEEDVALSKETTHGTEHYVKDLTLYYLPGVSHWVQQEAPEQVNKIITAWLAKNNSW